MGLLLNIDTATETATVSFARDGKVIQSLSNQLQKDHAAFLQVAIAQLSKDSALPLNTIDAIAVAAGPGSYTGLRVGMASAKGLCYALQKPLITLNTLQILTADVVQQYHSGSAMLFCPMIDARRMEVFTALYNKDLTPVLAPCALVLNENSFSSSLEQSKIVFFGNGAAKWQNICHHPNASFAGVSNPAAAMAGLAESYFQQNQFANLAYSEPFYLKEFQDKI